jgi:hypothetical protein
MSDIKPISDKDYCGVVGNYGVINHGTGYGIIYIPDKEMIAHNITSYLDAYKTAKAMDEEDKEKEEIDLDPKLSSV